MKKWMHIASWVALSVAFMGLWSFSMVEQRELTCAKLTVRIQVRDGMTFITSEDVEQRLRASSLDPTGIRFSMIDLGKIEDRVREMQEVKHVKVYKTIDGNVFIDIIQRKPVVRIINANGRQFYLDEDGFQMPVSAAYTPRVQVVTGFLHEPVSNLSAVEIGKSEVLKDQLMSDDIFTLAGYIRRSDFWNAQIQEIYLDANGDFELVPTMGDHRIIFGTIEHMKGKFNKLKLFYEEGLRNMNWDRFSTINVKYRNQIVCTKK